MASTDSMASVVEQHHDYTKKLTGRAFYESIGSPKFVVAPSMFGRI